MLTKLVVLGAGGLARQIIGLVEDLNEDGHSFDIVGFLNRAGKPDHHGCDVIGDDSMLSSLDVPYVLGVGAPAVRRKLVARARELGCHQTLSLIHPHARASRRATVGEGAVVMAGADIMEDSTVGRHSHINLGALIGHGCRLGDYASISPHAKIGADALVGDAVMMGFGSIVLGGITVGDGATIGAGAVVTRDVPSGACMVGVPAEPIESRNGTK